MTFGVKPLAQIPSETLSCDAFSVSLCIPVDMWDLLSLHIRPLLFCPFSSTQSKNRYLDPRLCPEHCTSCPGAHPPCLCVRLHVLFSQPKELKSIEKPSSLLPLGLSRVLLGAGGGGVTQGFRVVNSPTVPFWFLSLFKCTFPSLQGFRPQSWHPAHHPPAPSSTSHPSSVSYSSVCYIDSLVSIQAALFKL